MLLSQSHFPLLSIAFSHTKDALVIRLGTQLLLMIISKATIHYVANILLIGLIHSQTGGLSNYFYLSGPYRN